MRGRGYTARPRSSTFQSPTNRVLNSVPFDARPRRPARPRVSIPYKSGPKFCATCRDARTVPKTALFQSPTNRVLNSVTGYSGRLYGNPHAFQSPTNRVLNSVGWRPGRGPQRVVVVSIPYKSGPKFCAEQTDEICQELGAAFQSPTNRVLNSVHQHHQHRSVSSHVSIPYKSGPKFCAPSRRSRKPCLRPCFNPLQIGS